MEGKLTDPLDQLHLKGCLTLVQCATLPTGFQDIRLCPDHMYSGQMSPACLSKKGLQTVGMYSQA